MTSLPLFSQTRPKISNSLVIRASPSHWKEGERPARARVTFTWISPHLPSLSRGELQKKGQMARAGPTTLTFSLDSLLFLSSNHLRPLSSPFEIFPLLYPHVLHPPILLGYTPVPPVPPTKKKKREERRAGGGIPEMWFVPEGSWWKNNNWEQGERNHRCRGFSETSRTESNQQIRCLRL